MANNSSKSGTNWSLLENTTYDYAARSGNADMENAIKFIRTKIEVLNLDPREKNKAISKSAKRRARKKLQLVMKRPSTTSLNLQIQNCDINVHNIKPKKGIDIAALETIQKLKSNVGHHGIDVEPGTTNVLESRTNSYEEHSSAAKSGPENTLNSKEKQRIVDTGIAVTQHKSAANGEHSLADKGLTEHMHDGTQIGATFEKNHSNLNKGKQGLQNIRHFYDEHNKIIESLLINRARKRQPKSDHFNDTKAHKTVVVKQQFKPIKRANKAKTNEKYRRAESIREEGTKKTTLTTKFIFPKTDLSNHFHPAAISYLLNTILSGNDKRCAHLSVYMFKIHFGANNLSNADIVFLLKLQNSIKIKRIECRVPMSETSSVMIVRISSHSEEILKQNKFKASLIRTTVTFQALALFVEEKQDAATQADTTSHEVNGEPFGWLGKWQTFNTVLNKVSSAVEISSSSTQEKLIQQSVNPPENWNYQRRCSN
ncbi:uncharacterized protein LOC110117665 [Ceratitis capitata]|uniref:uncharacterized protein LOC110117665 n=1 Tax=Ceratitis capitata TaxID=7213 RepID=UPI000C6C6F7C|nr:uncharacterized protein LOC110117665 [Ceratitis capitata]